MTARAGEYQCQGQARQGTAAAGDSQGQAGGCSCPCAQSRCHEQSLPLDLVALGPHSGDGVMGWGFHARARCSPSAQQCPAVAGVPSVAATLSPVLAGEDKDYTIWLAHSSDPSNPSDGCILGYKEQYRRLRKSSMCQNGRDYVVTKQPSICPCTLEDFLW